MELSKLKKEYGKSAEKYSLPNFKEMNENFDIERITEDSDILLKCVKKLMMEKIISLIGFVEMLSNPMNAPRMYLGYLQSVGEDDRKAIERIYGQLAELNLDALECEVDYGEGKEAELIKKIFRVWGELKEDFRTVLRNIKKPNSLRKKEKDYYG